MTWDKDEHRSKISELLIDLFPICRSITGDGNRATFRRLMSEIPLIVHEVASGTKVFDWTVPDEWNVTEGWIKSATEETKVIDFKKNNLHVMSYSEPVRGRFSFSQLRDKIHTLPQNPNAIPYRTSYYKRDWGFCMSQNQLEKLDKNGEYEICIESTFNDKGSLTYADLVHKGESSKEVLISTYCCHPSMANDNLSGVVLATLLFKYIQTQKTFYTYRLVIAPETVGVIAYLHENKDAVKNVVGGTVVTTAGGRGKLGLKPTFLGETVFDHAARLALKNSGKEWVEYPFVPDGSDERQYSSPGFRIPTVSITKDKYYEYSEYHTSLDNLEFVRPEQLADTLEVYGAWFKNLEMMMTYERTEPHCEFQLGKRGLYPNLGGSINQDSSATVEKQIEALSWLMFGCDGKTNLLEISKRSKIDLDILWSTAGKLHHAGLLRAL